MTLGFRLRPRLAAALLLVACGGSTDPDGSAAAGAWRLVLVDGDSLPAIYHMRVVEGRTVEYRMLEARIEFRTRNRVYDIRRTDFLGPHTDTVVSGYAIDGTQLVFSRTGTSAYPAYSDTGTMHATTLTMRVRNLPGSPDVNALLTYTREP